MSSAQLRRRLKRLVTSGDQHAYRMMHSGGALSSSNRPTYGPFRTRYHNPILAAISMAASTALVKAVRTRSETNLDRAGPASELVLLRRTWRERSAQLPAIDRVGVGNQLSVGAWDSGQAIAEIVSSVLGRRIRAESRGRILPRSTSHRAHARIVDDARVGVEDQCRSGGRVVCRARCRMC